MVVSRVRAAPHDAVHSAFLAVTAMFLFGYQMHEKTVLLPLVLLTLAYPRRPSSVLCATMAAMLSMFDLLRRDGHVITYFLGMLLVAVVFYTRPATAMQRVVFAAAVCAVLLFHAAEALLPPPSKYPWIYPYLAAVLCCSRQDPHLSFPRAPNAPIDTRAAFPGRSSRPTQPHSGAPQACLQARRKWRDTPVKFRGTLQSYVHV